jgi:hypothetical protein
MVFEGFVCIVTDSPATSAQFVALPNGPIYSYNFLEMLKRVGSGEKWAITVGNLDSKDMPKFKAYVFDAQDSKSAAKAKSASIVDNYHLVISLSKDVKDTYHEIIVGARGYFANPDAYKSPSPKATAKASVKAKPAVSAGEVVKAAKPAKVVADGRVKVPKAQPPAQPQPKEKRPKAEAKPNKPAPGSTKETAIVVGAKKARKLLADKPQMLAQIKPGFVWVAAGGQFHQVA